MFDMINTDFGEEDLRNPVKRRLFTESFGWSIPSRSSLDEIVGFVGSDQVLEIAGGRGLWSKFMSLSGIDTICTSIIDGLYYNKESMNCTWYPVELLDCCEAVKKYNDRNCLFLSWGWRCLYNSLKYYKGKKLIVIGENNTCYTDYLDPEDDTWPNYGFKLLKECSIPMLPGNNDKMRFYVRE